MCPLECDSVNFQLTIDNKIIKDDLFAYFQRDFLNVSSSESYEKENIRVLFIYQKEIKYTHMSQTAKMTFIDLVSNFGGVLGVFLELSFFSVYRLVYFVLEGIFW